MSGPGSFGILPRIKPIEIDPAEGRVVWEEFGGVLIAGSKIERQPGDVGYWDVDGNTPDMVWSPSERRLRVAVNKKTQRVHYENETEDYVEIVISPRDAPDTGKLPEQPPIEYR